MGGIPGELFTHLDRLYQRAFEIVGISQLSAQSAKPAGLNSGKALREYNDIESERFLAVSRRYEDFYLEAARQMIDLAKEIAALEDDYEVVVPGKEFVDSVKWSEIDLEEDQYVMKCYPTGFLPSTPTGRFQFAEDLIRAGFVSAEEGLSLLDFPDTQSTLNLKLAPKRDIENMIERMVDTGEYEPPEPFQNLQLGVDMCKAAYLQYRLMDVPEERLELLRTWAEQALKMLQPPAPEMPPQMAAPTEELPPDLLAQLPM
jgi:hypothetical protein